MKKILICVFLLSSSAVSAQSPSADFASSLGFLVSPEKHGDWFFAEIRESDGSLSGCFASTAPYQGAFSFETADLNLLSFVEGGEVLKKIGINDVAVPDATGFFDFAILRSDAEMQGQSMMAWVAQFLISDPHASGRFTIMSKVSEGGLRNLVRGNQAGLQISDKRGPVYYSLRGSTAAIALWERCNEKL